MGMTAILINEVTPFEQTGNIPSTEGAIWNLVHIGQAVLEKNIFEDYMILNMY